MNSSSTISTTTIVRGNVSGDGSLEILGRIEGSVSMTGQVIVAPNAVVKGNVNAAEIQVAGSILGNLTASDLVMLNTGARVVGDLEGARIGVAEGALVRGLVRTEGEPPLEKPVPPVPARAAAPASKAGLQARPAFAPASMPRPTTTAAVATRPAPAPAPAPKPAAAPVPQAAPHALERAVVHEPEPEVDDELEVDEPTNPPPPPRNEPKPERSGHAAPPMVVPAIKGQVKAKKKKGR